ncbi:hypothetical protein [Paenibacillus aquistagni]|uniref:hypothetical protein n=1 Tax=Paenibacillus aquistagni TaxID=1852522 RepID=UPI000B4FE8E8|nr:hypothetical protein [Paenibacillus aquistagni]
MSFNGKTNWQFDEVVKESDLNRIEQGIVDAHAELDTTKLETKTYTDEKVAGVTPKAIGAVNKNDFDGHVSDTGLHVTATKQAVWDAKETSAGAQAKVDAALVTAKNDATSKANQAEMNAKNASIPKKIPDTRDSPTHPSDYKSEVKYQFKSASTVGIGGNGYAVIQGIKGWHDDSGGNSHEIAFTDNGIMYRKGTSAGWDAWGKIPENSDIPVRVNNRSLEYFDGYDWREVGGLIAKQPMYASFSRNLDYTSSTNWYTVLDISGKKGMLGRIGLSSSPLPGLRLTIDGIVTVLDYNSWYKPDIYMPIAFSSSLKVEIARLGGDIGFSYTHSAFVEYSVF